MKTVQEKTFDVLESTGTNWSAVKKPLITAEGLPTPSFGIFRSDNNGWLGTVKDRYEVMQNSTLVEMLIQATDMLDLTVSNGGTLKSGAKVFYQIALPEEYIGKSNVKRQVTALNSHDGSLSIAFGSSNTVVVCQNTFFKAHRELNKVKHGRNAYAQVLQLANDLRTQIAIDNKLMETFKRMADVEMRDEMVERVISKIFPKVELQASTESLHTRTKNNILTFADNLNTEIQLEGKTVWGLFNAVTRYTNHSASPKEEQAKREYLMLGGGLRLSNLAFDELLKFVDGKTAEYHFINA